MNVIPLLKINQRQAIAYLRTLGYKDGDKVHLRFFYPSDDERSKNDGGRKLDGTFPNLLWQRIEGLQADGRGCHVVVNPGGHDDKSIKRGRVVFYEHDNLEKDLQRDLWQQLKLPEPSCQVDTSGKSIHSYLTLSDPCTVQQWRELQADLLDFVDGDRNLKNPSRTMRLAGGWHMGTGEQVALIANSGKTYSYEMLRTVIPKQQRQPEPESIQRWHEFRNNFKLPTDDAVPLYGCLTVADRKYIDSGAGEGERNGKGYTLSANLVATSDYLATVGQRYDGTPEQLFDRFCDNCSPPIDSRERERIWKSASSRAKTTSLPPDVIESCIAGLVWRQLRASADILRSADVVADVGSAHSNVIPIRISTPSADVPTFSSEIKEELEEMKNTLASEMEVSRIFLSGLSESLKTKAASMPIATDALVAPLLSMASGIVGSRVSVQVKLGWEEPLIIWSAVVMDTGSKKTPALSAIRKPLDHLQIMEKDRYDRDQAEYLVAERKYKERRKGDDIDPPIPPLPMRNFFMDNATLEAVYASHAEELSKHGFCWVKDELAGLFNSFDQYKVKGGDTWQNMLSLWSGATVKINRKSGGNLLIPRSHVSLFGFIQPSVWIAQKKNPDDADGMFARILASSPVRHDPIYVMDEVSITKDLLRLYENLDKVPAETVLHFTPSAQALFVAHVDGVASKLREARPEAERAFLSKTNSHVARLAGMIHLLDAAWSGESPTGQITSDQMKSALYLVDYYHSHFIAMVTASDTSELPPDFVKALSVIDKAKDKGATFRELAKAKRFHSSDKLKAILSGLVEMGFIEKKVAGKTERYYSLGGVGTSALEAETLTSSSFECADPTSASTSALRHLSALEQAPPENVALARVEKDDSQPLGTPKEPTDPLSESMEDITTMISLDTSIEPRSKTIGCWAVGQELAVGDRVEWDNCPSSCAWMSPFKIHELHGGNVRLESVAPLAPLSELRRV